MGETANNLKWCIENWKTLVGLLTFFATITGWYTDNVAKAEEIAETNTVMEIYRDEAARQHPIVQKTLKTVHVVRSGCSKCDRIERELDGHVQRHKQGYLY